MDEEGDFDIDNLYNEENVDEEDSQTEEAIERAYEDETGLHESDSDNDSDSDSDPNIKRQIAMIEEEIDFLNTRFENGEISFEKYNELLIYNQMRRADEKLKLMNFIENESVKNELMSELDFLFTDLKRNKKQGKLNENLGFTVDDIFKKYGDVLENELSERRDFFESNPITSNISNVVNLPVPEKYQKQLQTFEQKLSKNDISIEDINNYLDLRLLILNENLESNLKHDVMYVRFHMELQLEFANLKSELELLTGETDTVIDEEITEFNKEHHIQSGSGKNLLKDVSILKNLIETKISNLAKKYESVQEKVFKQQDTTEVLKIIKQLREVYLKNEYGKLEKKFNDEEIVQDLKTKPLDYIVDKYGDYIESDYFSWATAKKKDTFEKPVYTNRNKFSEKEASLIKQAEIREYTQRKEFQKILSILPKEILMKCADQLIAQGKINAPFSKFTPQEKFINDLYNKSTQICLFSKNYSTGFKNYAKEIGRLSDELMIPTQVLEADMNLGSKIKIGDIVYIDRTYDLVRKAINELVEIEEVEAKIINLDKNNTVNWEELLPYLNTLKKTQPELIKNNAGVKLYLNIRKKELQAVLNSYNKYMRAPQLKGIAIGINESNKTIDVKINGASKIRSFPMSYVTNYYKVDKNELPVYIVADSDTFNPSSDLKVSSLIPISKWIKTVLKVDSNLFDIGNKEQAIELYDKALETYNSLSESERSIIDSKVMNGMSQKYVSQFINGVPNKGPLVFKYPPQLPFVSDTEEPSLEQYIEYSKNLAEYINNLTPETNPYVRVGVPITNQVIKEARAKLYPNLNTAVKNVPINGYFRLSSVNDFKSLVLKYMTEKEKHSMQAKLLTQEEIKEFMENIYVGGKDEKTEKKESFRNPKFQLLNELKATTDQQKYADLVSKIDNDIKIDKIVGDEVYINSKVVTKNNLEKMLISSLERKQIKRVDQKEDYISLSILDLGLGGNSTFQLLDLSNNLKDSYIVHTEPKYRIRIVNSKDQFLNGWVINPIKEIVNNQLVYTYKYPIIITDFTEYLKLYRNSLIVKYDNFRKLDILSYEEFTSSNYLLNQIRYISDYLKQIGQEDLFEIDLIKQEDSHFKIRQEQRKELLHALNFMYGDSFGKDILQNLANEIEYSVYSSFEDIRSGVSYTKNTNVMTSEDSQLFDLIKKFRVQNNYYASNILFYTSNKDMYQAYLYRISVAIFNVYRTNNFIQDYINGKVTLDSIIYRDLTKEEIIEKEDTVENLITWSPPTGILEKLRKVNPDVYDNLIKNREDIDISVINLFEKNVGIVISELNKKLALIELIRLKSWQIALSKLDEVPDSNKLMYLIKHRNALRSVNNITAEVRLNTYVDLYNAVSNCKIYSDKSIIQEYAENIELACYSLSNNKNEYDKISEDIVESNYKLCKLISVFEAGNISPVDIIANIAELYLDIKNESVAIQKAKLGDWNGIKQLPNQLLIAIKKVANSMSQIHTRYTSTKSDFKKDDQNALYLVQQIVKKEEYKVVKDSQGQYIIKQIEKPIVIDENKIKMNMLLQTIKRNYLHKLNNVLASELQKVIDKNELAEEIIFKLNSIETIDSKDIEILKSMPYSQLLEIYNNFYREPYFVDVIPMSMAREGIRVFPLKKRGGFLIAGKFPLDVRAYRYRDNDGNIRSKLSDICEWVGVTNNEILNLESVYSQTKTKQETEMLSCVKKLLDSMILVKIWDSNGNELVNSKEVLSKIITEFDMYKPIEESVIKYFNEYGGNKQLFPNGGTKEEYDSFLSNALYTEAMKKLLGVPTLHKKKELKNNSISLDDRVKVSILKNGDQVIYRKLYKSKTELYPVPIGYDSNNFPVYSWAQKKKLAFLIENGHISPWFKNKIKIVQNKGDIKFEGELPFVIDNTKESYLESKHYVEQIFRDSVYGLPIVTRIGILPKRIKGAEGHNIIKKIRLPENKYVIKEEPFRIKYFKTGMPLQTQIDEFKISEAQKSQPFVKNELLKKSGYALIDSRLLSYSLKYDPEDVWSWNPLTDYKVGAQEDNEIWTNEKNRQMAILKEWLKKSGSSSSAFIAAKNESTRYLQWFRINLPSQKRNQINQPKFRKPKLSVNEINLIKIKKAWKKYSRDKLLNEAKRIGFYNNDMNTMKFTELLTKMNTKLDEEFRINSQILTKIGVPNEIAMDQNVETIKIDNYSNYIRKMLKYNLIVISPEVMSVIESPKSFFPNYNRYAIGFDEDGNVSFIPKYNNEDINLNNMNVDYDDKNIPFLKNKNESMVNSNFTFPKSEPLSLEELKKHQLVELCRKNNLMYSGNKSELIARLKEIGITTIEIKKQSPISINSNFLSHDKKNDLVYETIYEILKNMSYTVNYGFNGQIIDYINDVNLFEKLEDDKKKMLLIQYPILKIIFKLKKEGKKNTIWNILTTVCDTFYPDIYSGMKEETIEHIRKYTLKYSFEEPIEIKMEDVVNYLGDSYYQNSVYDKGIIHDTTDVKNLGKGLLYVSGGNTTLLYLQPGYKYDKLKPDEVSFTDTTSFFTKYSHNPYITLFRNINDKDPKTSIEILVVGNELHNKIDVSSNIARRLAFMYGIDPRNVDPLFSIPDPNISGKYRNVVITEEDVLKYMAKGGNYYTVLEIPDDELVYSKRINNMIGLDEKSKNKIQVKDYKNIVTKYYKTAAKEYFKSKDKKRTFVDFIRNKKLNPLTLKMYIDKVEEKNLPVGQISNFIDNLNILPDFLDPEWPTKKMKLEKKFADSTGINLQNYVNGHKRNLYINIARPKQRLFTGDKIDKERVEEMRNLAHTRRKLIKELTSEKPIV